MAKKIKFSIIIPVYNVEQYLEECLKSVKNQTYTDFEVIIINDGSTDNSKNIIKKYKQKNTLVLEHENKGLSYSRNEGIKKAQGDYIIFLDSDDYLENNSLEILNKNIKDEDLIRFQVTEINETNNQKQEIIEKAFSNLKGVKAFCQIVNFKYVENAWLYCYNAAFLKSNNFFFKEGFYHEDFGLIPLILVTAKKVSSINNTLYYYRTRNNSIMNTNDQKKIEKKCNDFYQLGIENIKKISNFHIDSKEVVISYIANSLIIKGRELKGKARDHYYLNLRKDDIFELILKKTIKQKAKYLLAKYNYDLYLKVIK